MSEPLTDEQRKRMESLREGPTIIGNLGVEAIAAALARLDYLERLLRDKEMLTQRLAEACGEEIGKVIALESEIGRLG